VTGVIVIGLISGTSMDGIDVATGEFDLEGDTISLRPLGHQTVPYSDGLRAALGAALPPAATTLEDVCRLDTWIGQEFAAVAGEAADEYGADLIVSHGQTLFHWVEAGQAHGTLQVGQPGWIVERTGLPVISDVRSADVAAGGQGAPMVSMFDVLLLPPGDRARAALNLGGIANFTVIPTEGDPFAYDAGPANALIDAAVALATDGAEHQDTGGKRARRGTPVPALLDVLGADPYYGQAPPKTTGKEHFNAAYLEAAIGQAGGPLDYDSLIATVTHHAASVVAADCARFGLAEVVASGGGVHNPVLLDAIRKQAPGTRFTRMDDHGIDGDAKEAYAFGLLGFLTACGLPGTVPSCTGARHATILGRINLGRQGLPMPPRVERSPARLVVVP
jgi:anhydro-N-acetylmuramic acid kinase